MTTEFPTESLATPIARRGDLQKCPVCGMPVDPDAYHCPHCHNYYCFNCRARLLRADRQCQCTNKDCAYYGKLVCGVCDPEVRKDEAPGVYLEPEDGYWPLLFVSSLVVAILTWIASSFLPALLVGFVAFTGVAYALRRIDVNVFGKVHEVSQPRTSAYHTCICCQQPAKEIRGTP